MKRFYVVLLSVFVISAVLLGLSYSKDAGQYGVNELGQIIDDKYRVVFSTSDYLSNKNLNTEVGIINKTKEELTYVIKLIPEVGKNISYSVNDAEYQVLEERNVYSGKLKAFGQDGDFVLNKIAIKCDGKCSVKVEIKTTDKEYLLDLIKKDADAYEDDGVLRYIGASVDNYLLFNGSLGRIVKIVDGKVYLISNPDTVGSYKVDGNAYLELSDYLASFGTGDILESDILNSESWLTSDVSYWLEGDNYIAANREVGIQYGNELDVHHIRSIKTIDIEKLVVNKGDGSIGNPYEVSYGS